MNLVVQVIERTYPYYDTEEVYKKNITISTLQYRILEKSVESILKVSMK